MVRQLAQETLQQHIYLHIRQPEHFHYDIQHGRDNQQHGLIETEISHLADHQIEQFSKCPVILVVALCNRKEHVSDENDGNVCRQGVIGQSDFVKNG